MSRHFPGTSSRSARRDIVPIIRDMVSIGWPLAIGQIVLLMNGLSDTILTGHYDPLQLAALGVGMSIWLTVFVTFFAVMQSLTPLASHFIGKLDHPSVGVYGRQAVWMGLFLSAIGFVILQNAAVILAVAHVPETIRPSALRYIQIVSYGLPGSLLSRIFISLTSAVGRTWPVVSMNVLALGVKLPLSVILMFGLFGAPRLGIAGCAIGTVAMCWVSAATGFAILAVDRSFRACRIFEGGWRPHAPVLAQLVRSGLPMGISQFVDISAFYLIAILLAHLGVVVASGQQIFASLLTLLYVLPFSIGIATQVLIARSLGEGRRAKARIVAAVGIFFAACFSGLCSICLLIAPAVILHLYTRDATVLAFCGQILPLVVGYQFFDAIQTVCAAALRGYGVNFLPAIVYIGSLWAIGLGLGSAFAFHVVPTVLYVSGATAMWGATSLSLAVAAISLAIMLERTSYHHHRVPSP